MSSDKPAEMKLLRTNRRDHKPIIIIIHPMPSPFLLSHHHTLLILRQSRHNVSYGVREKSEDPCSADGHRIPRVSAHRGSHPSVPTHFHQSVSPLVYLHLHANDMTNSSSVWPSQMVVGTLAYQLFCRRSTHLCRLGRGIQRQ
jgi:hypothetical protein